MVVTVKTFSQKTLSKQLQKVSEEFYIKFLLDNEFTIKRRDSIGMAAKEHTKKLMKESV